MSQNRNNAWMKHEDNEFTAEDSMLHHTGRTDPWERPLPTMMEHRDSDNDVTHWTGVTTFNSQQVKLTIWND